MGSEADHLLLLMLKLRMSVDMHPVPLYDFMVHTATNLPFL
jgi:hypothetical protein